MATYVVQVAMTEKLEVIVDAGSREGAVDEVARRLKNLYGCDVKVEVSDLRLKE